MVYIKAKNELANKANKKTFTKIPNKYALCDLFEKHYGKKDGQKENNHMLKERIVNDKIDLDIISLNVCGIKNNKIYVNQLCGESDVLCLQELLHGQAKVLHKHINLADKQIFQRIGTKTSTRGRYSGGMAFVVNKHINVNKSEFRNNNIGILHINNLIIINVYLPYYKGTNDGNTEKFESDLNWLMEKVIKFKQERKEVLIYGDFNTDFSKEYIYSKLLFDFMRILNMSPSDILNEFGLEYTYEKKFKKMVIRTWIDHVLTLDEHKHNLKYINIMRGINNTSDHCVIKSKYSLHLTNNATTILGTTTTRLKEIKWEKEELRTRYRELIDKSSHTLLRLIDDHINCNCEEERVLITTCFFNELSSICINANNVIINEEQIKKTKKKWKISVDEDASIKLKSLHRKQCLAYVSYRDSDPPWNEQLGNIYYKYKKDFKKLLHFHEKNKSNRKFKELNELFKYDTNNFWRSVKKMTQLKQIINVPLHEIVNIYKTLFNTSNMPDEERDSKDVNDLEKLIKDYQLNKDGINEEIKVTPERIERILKNKKNGKAVGFTNVSNEMLKYGCNSNITTTLAYFMEWIINSGSIPKLFNISLLKPLIKDTNKSADDPNNLRPLSISDVYPSIYEEILEEELLVDHEDHKKQFGFKTKSSCSHATFLLNETIKICKELKKPLIVVSIDASKAFDRVNRIRLWIKLFEMKIRPNLIISLYNYYKEFKFIVNNDKDYSSLINTTYGVKQGGNVSPALYKIYTETIAIEIDKLNVGVKIGKCLINVLMYADDVIVLANSEKDAQSMLDVITRFGHEYQVKYNPDKTNVMVEDHKNQLANLNLKLCNKELVHTNQIKYLGSQIEVDGKINAHIDTRKNKANASINNLKSLGILNTEMSISNKIKLFNIYVRPILYYGNETMYFNKGNVDTIRKIEGNLLKQVIGIPYGCKSELIYSALNMPITEESLIKNQMKFLKRALENDYINEFIEESFKVKTKLNIIGALRLKTINGSDVNFSNLNEFIEYSLNKIDQKVYDRYHYNNDAKEVEEILNIDYYKYRNFKLINKLYYKQNILLM